MVGNSILDQVIEQARQRNAQTQAAQQARLASLPTPTAAPIPMPIVDNGGGEAMQMTAAPSLNPQQQYDQANKFLSMPTAVRAVMPMGMVGTALSQYQANQAAQNPYVQTSVTNDPFAPKSAVSWAKAQPQMQPEINAAWNAKRAQFVNAEKRAAEDEAQMAGMGGWGGTQSGMTASNFGATGDDASFAAIYGGNYGDDGGGFDSGFGDADAMGGDMDASSFGAGGDFGGDTGIA